MHLSVQLPLSILLLCLVPLTGAHMIDVPASTKACFFEDLHVNDQMTVTYQVGQGGSLDINFWLADPDNIPIAKHHKQSTGTAKTTAQKDGRYTYCFSNEMSNIADKLISFNVHGVVYIPDDGTIAPIEKEIRDLAVGLQAVKDEQEYIVIRERVHRNTAESTNTRVKWWSVAQTLMLFLICGFQIYYLKSFFEIKRVI